MKRLADSRLVTLTGVGGSGKTRLGLQTAAESFDDFPDGVWIAEMAGLAEAERFPHWVAEEMGFARSAGSTALTGAADNRSWIEVVIDYLSPRTALLLLDNCEHLIGAAAEFAEQVLRASPNLKILTTSREGLGIRGEYLIQVRSLGLPSMFGDDDTNSGAFPDAMELFAERAASVNARFVLDDNTAPTVADICRRLDQNAVGHRTRCSSDSHTDRRSNIRTPRRHVPTTYRWQPNGAPPPTDAPRHRRLVVSAALRYGTVCVRPAGGVPRRFFA